MRRMWENASNGERAATAAVSVAVAGVLALTFAPETTESLASSSKAVAVDVAADADTVTDNVAGDVVDLANSAKNKVSGNSEGSPLTTLNTEQAPQCINIQDVSIYDRIGSVIIAMGTDTQLDQFERTMIDYRVTNFGLLEELHDTVTYRGQNAPIGAVTKNLQKTVEEQTAAGNSGEVWFMLDEEGGTVQKTKTLSGFEHLPSASDQSNSLTAQQITTMYREHGAQLIQQLGVDVVLAPLADVGQAEQVTSRSYGRDIDTVVQNAGSAMLGYQSVGVKATLKHAIGLGFTTEDSHFSAANTPPIDVMREKSIPAFKRLVDLGAEYIMVSHAATPGLTQPGVPASMSPEAYPLIRDEIVGNNDVIVMTDHLNMAAIGTVAPGDTPEQKQGYAAITALNAGADMVMVDLASVPLLATTMQDGAGTALDANRLNESARRILIKKGEDVC